MIAYIFEVEREGRVMLLASDVPYIRGLAPIVGQIVRLKSYIVRPRLRGVK